MSQYRSIYSKIWEDGWFTELDSDGKVLWLYLLTNFRVSVAGIYEILPKTIANETDIDKSKCLELVKQFEEDGKIFYADGVMWVKKLRDYQESGSPTVAKRIESDVKNISDGDVKRLYCEHYNIPYAYHIDKVSVECAYPVTGVSAERKKERKEKERERERKEKESSEPLTLITPSDVPVINDFDLWYAHYPVGHKKAGGTARKAWEVLSKANKLPPVDVMIDALEKQKKCKQWAEQGGKYIPYPATYLRGERWNDDIDVVQYSDDYYKNDDDDPFKGD